LQGHPEAGALWESTSIRFSTISISCIPHASEASTGVRSAGSSSFCADKSTTRCRLSRSVCGARFDLINWKDSGHKESPTLLMVLTLTSDVSTSKSLVSPACCLARMLKAHGWDKPSPTEKSDSKPIKPLAASTAEKLSTSVGPA
jgi:hypothetical protein